MTDCFLKDSSRLNTPVNLEDSFENQSVINLGRESMINDRLVFEGVLKVYSNAVLNTPVNLEDSFKNQSVYNRVFTVQIPVPNSNSGDRGIPAY